MREYVYVMGPVAFALDLLQRDKNMYAGYLIPTVLSLERKLSACRLGEDGQPLKYCGELVNALLEAIRKPNRFGNYITDQDLSMATCLLPCFKLHWTSDSVQPMELKAALLVQLGALSDDVPRSESRPMPVSALQAQESEVANMDVTAEDDFFGFNSYRRTSSKPNDVMETAAEELERYLNSPFTDQTTVESCYALRSDGTREYPRLCRLFLKYNTALPSSGSLERLLSRAGHSFSSLRNQLGDTTLETELLLKVNSQFWQK